jgi:hypothetical protein
MLRYANGRSAQKERHFSAGLEVTAMRFAVSDITQVSSQERRYGA